MIEGLVLGRGHDSRCLALRLLEPLEDGQQLTIERRCAVCRDRCSWRSRDPMEAEAAEYVRKDWQQQGLTVAQPSPAATHLAGSLRVTDVGSPRPGASTWVHHSVCEKLRIARARKIDAKTKTVPSSSMTGLV